MIIRKGLVCLAAILLSLGLVNLVSGHSGASQTISIKLTSCGCIGITEAGEVYGHPRPKISYHKEAGVVVQTIAASP